MLLAEHEVVLRGQGHHVERAGQRRQQDRRGEDQPGPGRPLGSGQAPDVRDGRLAVGPGDLEEARTARRAGRLGRQLLKIGRPALEA